MEGAPDLRGLADAITPAPATNSSLSLVKGTVTAIASAASTFTATVTVNGVSIPNLQCFTPVAVNDAVWLVQQGPVLVVVGRAGGGHTHDAAAAGDMLLSRYLVRQQRPLVSGGVLKWSSTGVLTGTTRLMVIPTGLASGHFVFGDGTNPGGAWTSPTVPAHGILYYRATDAEFATAGQVVKNVSALSAQDYTAYTAQENDIIIGYRDGDSGLFYLSSGQILDYWRTVTFTNSWAQHSDTATGTVGYMKVDGWVRFRGHINGPNQATVCFNLPAGYRPGHRVHMFTGSEANNIREFRIAADGNLTPQQSTGSGYSSLSGLCGYLAEN